MRLSNGDVREKSIVDINLVMAHSKVTSTEGLSSVTATVSLILNLAFSFLLVV